MQIDPNGPRQMFVQSAEHNVICSVVFVDIVEYSTRSMSMQMTGKRQFDERVASAIEQVPVLERMILDTGDGVAIGFVGDPEVALYAAMAIRRSMFTNLDVKVEQAQIRVGVNMGPVRLVTDLNGRPNMIGDGINVAERVMSFAAPGQILVSRSFRDVISCISADYSALFTFLGARTDKHTREHELFTLDEADGAFARSAECIASRLKRTNIGATVYRPRAVIAEDEQVLREELCELLSSIWPELDIVATVGDGLAAIHAIETLKPDIVFLDIQMPRLTGIEVARAVSGRVHVVMATAYDHHAINAFDAGVIDYILKPYNAARLVATCQRVKQRLEKIV